MLLALASTGTAKRPALGGSKQYAPLTRDGEDAELRVDR